MLRKNQKEEMPFAYYLAKYAGLDSAEVTARLGGDVTFDGAGFRLSFLGRLYRLAWPDYAIESPDAAALALRKMPAQTFLLRKMPLIGSIICPPSRFARSLRSVPESGLKSRRQRIWPAPSPARPCSPACPGVRA